MDNLPPNNSNQNLRDNTGENPPDNQNAGNVFESPPVDTYSSQLSSESAPPEGELSPMEPTGDLPPPPVTSETTSSPPFEEDNKGKILLIAGIVFLVLLLIFGLFKILGKGKSTSSKEAALTYWGLWEDPQTIKPLIDEYEKSHSNIKITYTKQSQIQYRERLQAALQRGDGPDIFRYHNTWVPMLLDDLSAMPSTIYTPDEFDKTFYPVAKNDLSLDGKYYGIPLEIDGLVVLYNTDILTASNLTVPQNWEDFRSTALKLTVKDANGRVETGGVALGSADNIEHFSDIVALMFLQNGTNLKDPLGPCTDTSTTSCASDTLIFYRKFAEQPNNTWDDTMDNSISAFAGGKVAMIFAPTWEIFTIKQLNPNLNFKVAPIPQLPGVTLNWATYWVEGVSKRTKNQLAAWEFLKFLSSKDSLVKLYTQESKTRIFGEPYSRVDLGTTLSQDPNLGTLISEAPTMKSFPLASSTKDNGINDQMIKYLLDGINSLKQGGNPSSALELISRGFKQVLTQYGVLAAPPTASQ